MRDKNPSIGWMELLRMFKVCVLKFCNVQTVNYDILHHNVKSC